MDVKILGLSGKKQSGKTTTTNFILGHWMEALSLIDSYGITDTGQLYVYNLMGQTGVFDIERCDQNFRKEHLDDFIRIYSYADMLKQEVCMKVLGLSYKQCYGTDEDKNTLTNLLWENMPGVYADKKMYDLCVEANPMLEEILVYHEPGPMTAREVMQYVGTEIFRKMYDNVWVDATIRRIKEDQPLMAIITDVRFPNEVSGIHLAEGKVGRFTRQVAEDTHYSETALDKDTYDWTNFDFVWDNQEQTIKQQIQGVFNTLNNIEWLPQKFTDLDLLEISGELE